MDHAKTLASIHNNGVQIRDTLLQDGYMNPQNNFDCPTSPVKDFDDYNLIYLNNSDLQGVQCGIEPALHRPSPTGASATTSP
jgi:hypothetical protein